MDWLKLGLLGLGKHKEENFEWKLEEKVAKFIMKTRASLVLFYLLLILWGRWVRGLPFLADIGRYCSPTEWIVPHTALCTVCSHGYENMYIYLSDFSLSYLCLKGQRHKMNIFPRFLKITSVLNCMSTDGISNVCLPFVEKMLSSMKQWNQLLNLIVCDSENWSKSRPWCGFRNFF
jgi:hypothetical protein